MTQTTAALDNGLRAGGAERTPVLVALATGLGGFVLLQGLAWLRAGGVFEYPLDDVYIHLAIGEQIARGGYGVNAAEAASAGSSPLYPFLLMPFAEGPVHRFLPLLLNTIGLAVACGLWGRIVTQAGFAGGTGAALAGLGPLGLNMAGVAFLGMEHGLHVAASLAVVLGLYRFLAEGRIGLLLMAGVVLAPAVRLEGLALSGLAVSAVLWSGHWRAALTLGAGAVAPVAAFMVYLNAMGLAFVPNSVSAKMVTTSTLAHLSWLQGTLAGLVYNVMSLPGVILVIMAAVAAFVARMAGENRPVRVLAAVIVLAIGAHLAFGQMNWAHRYEHYVVVCGMAGLILILGAGLPGRAWATVLPLGLILILGGYYNRDVLTDGIASPRALHLQQAQMARFAQGYVQAPVAVNDLGRVAYANPHYVLDLWGLASPDALQTRLAQPGAGWAAPLAVQHQVPVAMIYDHWLGNAVGPDWVKLGALRLGDGNKGFMAGDAVDFYATSPQAAAKVAPMLARFADVLPKGAVFDMADPAALSEGEG